MHIIGAGGPQDKLALKLETRARNHIPNELKEIEKSPESLRAGIEFTLTLCPHIKSLSTSSLFNCMGLVFGSRRVWIDDTDLAYSILKDDGFSKLAEMSQVGTGDVVIYEKHKKPTHVALVHEIEWDLAKAEPVITVISQWGETGEFIHDWKHVHPQFGEPSSIWSKRNNY